MKNLTRGDDLDLNVLPEDEDGAEVHESPWDAFIRGKPVFKEASNETDSGLTAWAGG